MRSNREGKYAVFGVEENQVVIFDYSVDAEEALKAINERGGHRYILLDQPKEEKIDVKGSDQKKSSAPAPKNIRRQAKGVKDAPEEPPME